MCLVVLGEGSQTSHSLMCIQALMLWGAVQAKTFEQEFIEAAMQSDATGKVWKPVSSLCSLLLSSGEM